MSSSFSSSASTSFQLTPSFIINANAASSPSSTSSQQIPSELNNYEVFINFRGKDIRDGFLSFLFESLKEKGINTFKDENLKKGTEITPALKQTIQESCISIVIFSKNYADSPWCLDELVVINKCREKGGQMVLPVFYRVDPTDVQELRGPFTKALARLLQDHSDRSHNLGGWCHALKTISNDLGAFVSNEIKNDQMLVQRIVNRVSEILSHMPSNASYHEKLVGIDSRVEEVISLLRVEEVISLLDIDVNDRNWIIGIWGMAGIGKTTLAGIVFSQIKAKFDAHCFVSNVKQQIKKETAIVLRDRIIRSLTGEESLKMGSQLLVLDDWILRRLQRKKVLIVFDDVDDSHDLDLLAGNCSLYRKGSRIIITSTDRQVLKNVCHEEHICQVKGLIYEEALQLFSLHAFHQNEPKEGYVLLSQQVRSYAQGNPLALKVLGSSLYGKEKEYWESQLLKLKSIPNKRIQDVLKISYDGLDRNEQSIFLDIACFFGKGDTHENKLEKIIERNEECKQPGGRSRLWNPDDISHVFKTNTGTDKIECISLKMFIIEAFEISSKTFMKMPNLRFLIIFVSKMILPDGLDFLPEELRYLDWYSYPLKSLPLKFCPNNLVQLHLHDSNNCGMEIIISLLESLKVMDLPSSLSFIENFGPISSPKLRFCQVPSVRIIFLILDLRGCSKLEECPELPCNLLDLNLSETAIKQLPSSIGHCSQLVALPLSGCTKLENLPDCIGQLKSLKQLDARRSGIKTLPSSFNQLSRLECLYFEGCKGLTVWSSSLSSLNSLRKLYLGNCGISEIPESIGSLVSLKELYLDRNGFESIPASIKQLSNLEILKLDDCKRLRYLPELPCTKLFSASNCTSLEFVSFSSFCKAETEDDRYAFLNFGNCIKLGDTVRLQITEALFSAQQGRDDHNLCFPEVEVPQSMKYRTSGSHLSIQLERPDRMLGFYIAAVFDFQYVDFDVYDITIVGNFQDKAGKMYDCNFFFRNLGLLKLDSKHVFLRYMSSKHEINFIRVSFRLDHISVKRGGKAEFISRRVINCGIHPIYREEYRKAERRNERRKELDKDIVQAANTELWEKNSRQRLY
ncbi:disease resistance protein RUN1 [Jatropha curcas]|uniref:disease resistance protein RUN1 n=1 Tax=Jatropha curcas TaxID=180498 RepID=UPI001893CBE0|nr:disease resistance protein RUN1 [Jatropha curcas]